MEYNALHRRCNRGLLSLWQRKGNLKITRRFEMQTHEHRIAHHPDH